MSLSKNPQLSSSHRLGWITSPDATVCFLCWIYDCTHLLFTLHDDTVVIWWKSLGFYLLGVARIRMAKAVRWETCRQWAVISTMWKNSQYYQVKKLTSPESLLWEEIFQQQFQIQDRQQTVHELNKKKTCGRGKKRERNQEKHKVMVKRDSGETIHHYLLYGKTIVVSQFISQWYIQSSSLVPYSYSGLWSEAHCWFGTSETQSNLQNVEQQKGAESITYCWYLITNVKERSSTYTSIPYM